MSKSEDDELNKQYRAEQEEKNREFNKKLTAYHTLMGAIQGPLEPITFNPSNFTDKIKAIEAIGTQELQQTIKDVAAAKELGTGINAAELALVRAWAPFTAAKLEGIQNTLQEFLRQRREINSLLDIVYTALQLVSSSENNTALFWKQRLAELEAIEAANKGEQESV